MADLAKPAFEGWQRLSLIAQLANVGSEVGRALEAYRRQDADRLDHSLTRALDLFDLTLRDDRNAGRRREVCRAREVFLDLVVGDNAFGSTAEGLDAYFTQFGVASRLRF